MSHSPISGKKGGKNFGTGGIAASRSRGSKSFSKKAHRNPKSQHPGKNTKSFTKTEAKSNDQFEKESESTARELPSPAEGNEADRVLARLMKPRKSFSSR